MIITCEIYKESFSTDFNEFMKNPSSACFRIGVGEDTYRTEFILTREEAEELCNKITKSFVALDDVMAQLKIK